MQERQVGKIFALEGTAASGKSSLLRQVRDLIVDQPFRYNVEFAFLPEAAESVMGIFPLGRRATVETEIALLSSEAVRVARMADHIMNGHYVIADRCWISNTVLAQVRQATTPGYSFDASLYAVQERVLQILHPLVFTNTVLIYLDLPPDATFERQPWRRNMGEWVPRTYEAYARHLSYLEQQQPIWIEKAAARATQLPVEPPPPGVATTLPEPLLSPYAGIERIDANRDGEAVLVDFLHILRHYSGEAMHPSESLPLGKS